MHALKQLCQLMAVSAVMTVSMAGIAMAQHGTCGVYRYHEHEGGKCVDAREKPGGQTWSDEMLAAQGKWHG